MILPVFAKAAEIYGSEVAAHMPGYAINDALVLRPSSSTFWSCDQR